MAEGYQDLFRVASLPEALDTLVGQLKPPQPRVETVPTEAALGRFLAADIVSRENIPPFARSTVDGYAVRSSDTFGASESSPAYLKLVGRVLMGQPAPVAVAPGEAAAAPTGGMLPEGADAVVMVEYAATIDDAMVEISKPAAPGENVVGAGEDIREGTVVLGSGRRLRPQDLGALAALGLSSVEVFQPIRAGILSTGDEIVDIDAVLREGQVRDINYFTLAAAVRLSGGAPERLGICPDNAGELLRNLRRGVETCQIVLVSGGSSVGAADLTPAVINELGPPGVLVHGLSVKPGKPTVVALVGQVPVFGLPGHPVSALDIFRLMVDPVIRYLYTGRMEPRLAAPRLRARLSRNVASVAGREDRVRVILEENDGEIWAHPVLGRSGLISLMVRADGVAVIPYEAEGIGQGGEVTVELIQAG